MENKFKVVSKYKPTGDQPQAIEKIAEGFQKGLKFQTLLGLQVRAKPLPWQISLRKSRSRPWSLRTIKPLRHSFITS